MANHVIYEHHRDAEFRAFRSPTGMAGQWALEQANKVAMHARALAPAPGRSEYATGRTVNSIRAGAPTIGRSGPEVTVGAHTGYAVFLHEGTLPHKIKARPTNLGNKMVFFWRKVGRLVFPKEVNHPGTAANPFLVKALQAVFGGFGR